MPRDYRKLDPEYVNILFNSDLILENYAKHFEIWKYCDHIMSFNEEHSPIKRQFHDYLRNYKDKNNSYYLYFYSFFAHSKLDLLHKSVALGNGYAKAELASEILDEKDAESLFQEAYAEGCFYSLVKSVYIKLERLEDIHGIDDEELKDKDIKAAEILRDDIIKNLNILEEANVEDTYECIADCYMLFDDYVGPQRSKKEYADKYRKYSILSKGDNSQFLEDNKDILLERAKLSYELEEKYKQLQQAYDQMIQLKNMDFTNILNNQVGEYLNSKEN